MNVKTIIGCRYGRLVVAADSGKRSGRGEVRWLCRCDCGNDHIAMGGNLRSGITTSCGCFAREQSSSRAKAIFTKPKQPCSVAGCTSDVGRGDHGYCAKHAQRARRYGDPTFVTPEDVRRANSRQAQLARVECVKDTTYRKLHGRHEHRVIAEAKIGRSLLPGEHVHHIDEDKHNNHPDNLAVMSAAEHLRLHATK